MKNITAVNNAILNNREVTALPQVIIEWNMNRYFSSVVDNVPSDVDEGYDVEMFPVESLNMNNRPTKGINKARIGSGTISADNQLGTNGPRRGRFYSASVDDVYKYWTSPYPSDSSGSISKVKPNIIYAITPQVNKIVVTTENSWASASKFSIQTTLSATPAESDWTEVANQTTVGNAWKASGQIVIYWNGTDWHNSTRTDKSDGSPLTTPVKGLRLVVTQLESGYKKTQDNSLVVTDYLQPNANGRLVSNNTTGANSFFDLIELSIRLESDLSDYVMNVSDDFDMGEVSNLYPIGTTTTNQGSMTLSNLYQDTNGNWVPGLFSKDNPNSIYHNLIEPNALITVSYNYFDDNSKLIGSVQQFVLYIDAWSNGDDDTVSVDMSDFSKFFDNDDHKLPAALWENLTVTQLFARILDSIGFVDYEIQYDEDRVTDFVIPIFYCDGQSTVWEVIDELAKASQSAIFFNSFNKLQIKTRDFAFSSADSSVYTFNADSTPSLPANIVSLEEDLAFEPNCFNITYQKTNWDKTVKGEPTLQTIWTPDGDEVLRATPLVRDMTKDASWLFIGTDDVIYWPYSGLVNVEGELMRFDGKVFIYYTGVNGNTQNSMVINSTDEYNARNSKTPYQFRNKNHFNGALHITERGVWNSEAKTHSVDSSGYSVRQVVKGNHTSNVSGFRQEAQYSRVILESGSTFSSNADFRLATRGASDDSPFFNYGTRFRFIKASGMTTQQGGIVIHNSGNSEDGYYFAFRPSSSISAKERTTGVAELTLYSKVNNKATKLAQHPAPVVESIDAEIDISFSNNNGTHVLNLWFDGKLMISETVPNANKIAPNGKFGMFVQGKSLMEFEYLYAIARIEESPMAEDFSFLDKVQTGYKGYQWDREWVYRWKDYRRRVKKKSVKEQKRFNRMFFDEFGPIVHELREYDVKFDPSPVLYSQLYLTNDWSGCCLEYQADPFGAQFVLANTARTNAVLNGDDTISFSGTGNSIPQVLTVLGLGLIEEDAEIITAQNLAQIQRRGKIESDLDVKWLQSKAMAREVAGWMNDNFSYGNENVTLEIFANPLIEIGDVVHVTYGDKYIDSDYFVTSTKTEFDTGLSTTLGLRKRISQ